MAESNEHSPTLTSDISLQSDSGKQTKSYPISSNCTSYQQNKTLNSLRIPSQIQITPPTTPIESFGNTSMQERNNYPVFPNFLRAVYPFNPIHTSTDNAVTLEFNDGDIILIHSTHTNGWADGTLLNTGERGWLPTNYCKPYDPEPMRDLLKGLLDFWEQLRYNSNKDQENFPSQEFTGGIIAGVRNLLVTTQCLRRESILIRDSDILRRNRRAMLSKLSSLVKHAKILQEFLSKPKLSPTENELTKHTTRDMMLNAFSLIRRGARFLDIWNEELKARPQHIRSSLLNSMASVPEEMKNPPSPPTEASSFDYDKQSYTQNQSTTSTITNITSNSKLSHKDQANTRNSPPLNRTYSDFSPTSSHPNPMLRPKSLQFQRHSVSHRYSASIPIAQRQNLVSEKLNCSHDTLLSFLGSFIGRLHQESQSPSDFISAVQQFVFAGRELLTVVGLICDYDDQSSLSLMSTKNTMEERIHQLVNDAQDVITSSQNDEVAVVSPEQKQCLLLASTGCVKATGECVAKTKFVLERVGDFEIPNLDSISESYGLHADNQNIANNSTVMNETENSVTNYITNDPPASIPPPPPPTFSVPNYEKPLPKVPSEPHSLRKESFSQLTQIDPLKIVPSTITPYTSEDSGKTIVLPNIPAMNSPLLPQNEFKSFSKLSSPRENSLISTRTSSVSTMNDGSNVIFMNRSRNSETSMTSVDSTRATTPDQCLLSTKCKISSSEISLCSSQSLSIDDQEETESKLLEKTYAHELIVNGEGEIIGGSLPAIVERLTINDSTPDSFFVYTFYLTFRLFVTPENLALKLIDRFDYAGENPHTSSPVRLRVLNLFKGWLESYWCKSTDYPAISIIESFAINKLGKFLPSASQRLLDMTAKVSATNNQSLSYTSSINRKTSTCIAHFSSDIPAPNSSITKSTYSLLRNWKLGGSNPTILDFDPIELARQLTIIGMNIFCTIRPEELLASRLSKRSNPDAPNVKAMAAFSTDLSHFVWDTILQFEDVKKRANMVKHWIKIAQKCLELNNYDCLLAIVCSINSSSITRMKKTWEAVSQRRKDLFKSLLLISSNDYNRSTLRQRQNDQMPPCLPFIGIYLTDLGFVDLGNASTRHLSALDGNNGLKVINFDKYARMAKIICHIQRFQVPYRLNEVPEIQDWLLTLFYRVRTSLNGTDGPTYYYDKSQVLEPRESQGSFRIPIEGSFSSGYREIFDIFGWVNKDRSSSFVQSMING